MLYEKVPPPKKEKKREKRPRLILQGTAGPHNSAIRKNNSDAIIDMPPGVRQ
jgi:hypothetical protein